MNLLSKLTALLILLSSLAIGAPSRERIYGNCMQGNSTVLVTAGLNTSTTTPLMRSFPSCTVTVYLTGTLTIASIYSDNASTPKANPFTADSTGRWFWYADDGQYDIKLSGAGITTSTLGDIQPFDRMFLQNGSGAVERTVKNKLTDVISVKDFGALCDGSHDDTSAIQAAYDSITRYGYTINYPAGTCKFLGPITLPAFSLITVGQGYGLALGWFDGTPTPNPTNTNPGTILWNTGSGMAFVPPQADTGITGLQYSVRDIGFYGGAGIMKFGNLDFYLDATFTDVAAVHFSGIALEFGSSDGPSGGNSQFFHVKRCFFVDGAQGILNHWNVDLEVQDSVFQKLTGFQAEIRGANTRYLNNTFLGIGVGLGDILIWPTDANPLAGGAYNIKIAGNKFGNEDSAIGEQRSKISIGTAAQLAAHPSFFASSILIQENSFICPYTNIPGSTTSCIDIYNPLNDSIISGNSFINSTYAVNDALLTPSTIANNNSYYGNRHSNGTIPFKAGGKSFSYIEGNESGPQATIRHEERAIAENYIANSEAFGVWNAFMMNSTTCGISDPFGGTAACTLSKTAAAFASIGSGGTSTIAGPQVFSVWLKAGTLTNVSLQITDDMGTVLAQSYIAVDSIWRRYAVRVVGISIGTDLAGVVLPGRVPDSLAGTILAYGGQLQWGESPGDYVRTSGAASPPYYGRSYQTSRTVTQIVDSFTAINDATSLNPFAKYTFCETLGGVCYRWIMNNDGTFRLQRAADGATWLDYLSFDGAFSMSISNAFTAEQITSNKGLRINTDASQPTCAVGVRGLTWVIRGGSGVADIFQICIKNSSNNYVWVTK